MDRPEILCNFWIGELGMSGHNELPASTYSSDKIASVMRGLDVLYLLRNRRRCPERNIFTNTCIGEVPKCIPETVGQLRGGLTAPLEMYVPVFAAQGRDRCCQ